MAQDVVPYAQTDVKVDWVRGTDFSQYKTYAWGTSHQQAPDPVWNQHYIEDIDAALSAKGLHKVEMHANPTSSSLMTPEASPHLLFRATAEL
jgi:hypothetical protein